MTISKTLSATCLAVFMTGAVQAATIDPSSFDNIFTEGQRTVTVDGADVSGNAALSGNGDVGNFDLGVLSDNTLLVGRVTSTGDDEFFSTTATGRIAVTVLNYAKSSRNGVSPFSATFEFFKNGVLFGSETLLSNDSATVFSNAYTATDDFFNDQFAVRVTSVSGASDYDIGIAVSPVPVPAAGLMLLTGLGGFAAMRRRRKQS